MDRMRELYERFLSCGLMPGQFFKLSVNEAVDVVSSREKRRVDSVEETLKAALPVLDIFGGNLVEKILMASGTRRGGTFSLLEYFPEMFPQDVQGQTGAVTGAAKESGDAGKQELSAEMKIYKAKRIQQAYRVNQARAREDDKKHGR